MKKILIVLLILAISMLIVSTAFAAPPCNDTDGDGSPSGFEYGQYHIRDAAHAGILGQIHKPGTHHGFSICNPSGK